MSIVRSILRRFGYVKLCEVMPPPSLDWHGDGPLELPLPPPIPVSVAPPTARQRRQISDEEWEWQIALARSRIAAAKSEENQPGSAIPAPVTEADSETARVPRER
jgi:hypothetical protein